MKKVIKEEVVKVMAELKAKNFSQEDIGSMLGRTQQTIWAWGSASMPNRVPCRSEYEALKRLTVK